MKKIKIMNVPFDIATRDEALGRVLEVLRTAHGGKGRQIVTPNPEMLLEAEKNALFQSVLSSSWMSIPDGIGILWASRMPSGCAHPSRIFRFVKGIFSLCALMFFPRAFLTVFPERISGVDFMESLAALASQEGFSIFLLGAREGVAERVQRIFEARYPRLRIAGAWSGSPHEDDFAPIQARICETQPDLLFVAFGSPQQELWIARHLRELPSVKIAMGVGGAFDFIAGVRKRAPASMQKFGLEWLFRLLQEPSRIKRIWNATVRFPLRVMKL